MSISKNPRPRAPRNVTGVINEDGSISLNWDAVNAAQSYLIHYGDANESVPSQADKMGYTETNSWTLSAADVPTMTSGDEIYFYVQTYKEKGMGSNDIEKARYLHDGPFTGSAWSDPVVLINPS